MEAQFSANFFGAHQLTMLLLPAMEPHGEGRIVMTSSVMGIISSPGRGAYAASKYALEARSDALRMELRYSGIKVSLIEPGPINTRFTTNVNQTQRDKPVENPGIAARFTLGPEAVVEKVRHAFTSDKPQLRYPVTLVTHAVALLKRLLPTRLMDKIIRAELKLRLSPHVYPKSTKEMRSCQYRMLSILPKLTCTRRWSNPLLRRCCFISGQRAASTASS